MEKWISAFVRHFNICGISTVFFMYERSAIVLERYLENYLDYRRECNKMKDFNRCYDYSLKILTNKDYVNDMKVCKTYHELTLMCRFNPNNDTT